MSQTTTVIIYCGFALLVLLLIYMFIKFWNAPVPINASWVGTTFYVFSHEEDVAEIAPIEDLYPDKKNKGTKFLIPDSFGRLEPRKTYNLLKDETGELYVKQVAVML